MCWSKVEFFFINQLKHNHMYQIDEYAGCVRTHWGFITCVVSGWIEGSLAAAQAEWGVQPSFFFVECVVPSHMNQMGKFHHSF